ncbi:hypothetical protein B0H14DRAFT_2563938 [Mycena olivaceomarginata]|nr:hypothetical protein B0H14DRAFT_2563938 [Mycena olivaceomarginata]
MAFPCPTRWPAFNTPAEDSHHAALAKRVYTLQFTFDLNTDPETETDYYVSEDSDLDGDSEGSDSGVEDSEPLAPDLPQENCAAEPDIEIPGIERDEVDFENPPTAEEFWALFAIAMPRLLNLFTFSLSYDHYDENFLRRLIHLGNLAQSFPTSLLTMHLKPLPCHYSISRLDLDLEYAWDKPSWRSNISQIPYIRQLILSTPAYVVWPPSAKTFSRTRDEWTEQLGNRSSSKLRDIVINCSFLDGGLRVMYWAGNTRMPAEALRLTREIAGGQGFQWVWRLKDNEWKRKRQEAGYNLYKGSVGYERRLGAVTTVRGIKPGIGVSGCEGECVVERGTVIHRSMKRPNCGLDIYNFIPFLEALKKPNMLYIM